MTRRILKRKYKFDISLEDGVGGSLVSWVTGLMVFFVTLAFAASFGLNAMSHNWVSGLTGTMTIEMPPHRNEDKMQKLLRLLDKHPAVDSSRVLPRSEIMGLIEPWLGSTLTSDLPLPTLIDIRLEEGKDTAQLEKDILALAPEAAIDRHSGMLTEIKILVNTARFFVLLLTGIILTLAIAAIAGIVRAKLAIHQQEVETLHLIGSSDDYIARQFRHHILQGTLKGAAVGVFLTLAVLLSAGYASSFLISGGLITAPALAPWQWGTLIVLPILIGALIAHLTAQITVMKELARLP